MDKYTFNKKKMYSNFDRKSKWMGIIDYKTLWIIGIYLSLVVFFLSKINLEFIHKVYIFGFLSLPVCAMFICSDIKQDSIFDMFKIIVKFLTQRVIYTKENNQKLVVRGVIYTSKVNNHQHYFIKL